MPHRAHGRLMIPALLGVALILAACSNDGSDPERAQPPDAASPAPQAQTPEDPEAQAAAGTLPPSDARDDPTPRPADAPIGQSPPATPQAAPPPPTPSRKTPHPSRPGSTAQSRSPSSPARCRATAACSSTRAAHNATCLGARSACCKRSGDRSSSGGCSFRM